MRRLKGEDVTTPDTTIKKLTLRGIHLIELILIAALAIQLHELTSGTASRDLQNYGITSGTVCALLGLFVAKRWRPAISIAGSPIDSSAAPTRPPGLPPADTAHEFLTAAVDLLFQHFDGDCAAQDLVRAVARAVTEHRYQAIAPTPAVPATTT